MSRVETLGSASHRICLALVAPTVFPQKSARRTHGARNLRRASDEGGGDVACLCGDVRTTGTNALCFDVFDYRPRAHMFCANSLGTFAGARASTA